jgi:uncharacterized membrane protein YhaH (DUF805 family)
VFTLAPTKTKRMFRHPFSFEGRIRRTEYALSLLIYYAVYFIVAMVYASMQSQWLIFIAIIPMLWFMLAQGTKRCHDRGNNGAWQLIPFYALWMLFADGEPETNEYGPDPKGRGDLLQELLAEEQTAETA